MSSTTRLASSSASATPRSSFRAVGVERGNSLLSLAAALLAGQPAAKTTVAAPTGAPAPAAPAALDALNALSGARSFARVTGSPVVAPKEEAAKLKSKRVPCITTDEHFHGVTWSPLNPKVGFGV